MLGGGDGAPRGTGRVSKSANSWCLQPRGAVGRVAPRWADGLLRSLGSALLAVGSSGTLLIPADELIGCDLQGGAVPQRP